MASVFVLLEAFKRKEAAALGFFSCATASLDSFKSGTGEIAARLTVPDTSRSFQILPQGICNSFLYGIVPDCVFVFRVSAYKY